MVPVDGPPLRDGLVAVENGRIAWAGTSTDRGRPRGSVRALGRGVLLPGLVNAHCHLELSHLADTRGQGRRGFVRWVEALVERRARSSPGDARAAAKAAI